MLLAFTFLSAFQATRWNFPVAYQLARVRAGVIREVVMQPGHGIQGGGLTTSAVVRTAMTAHIEKSTYHNVGCMVSCVGHMEPDHKPKILLESRLKRVRCFTKMELTNNEGAEEYPTVRVSFIQCIDPHGEDDIDKSHI